MSSEKELGAGLQQLWRKFLPEMQRRLDVIVRALEALNGGCLSEALKIDAALQAHKLAGSLGSFGRHTGSEAALATEQIFSSKDVHNSSARAKLQECVQCLTREVVGEDPFQSKS